MEEEDDRSFTLSSRASSGKSELIRSLNEKLLRESLTRQDIGEVYEKLQSNYDSLLAKYAQAENTIDQLRIGARVDLFSDGPIPHQALPLQVIEVKSNPQPISFSRGDRAQINGPHQNVGVGTSCNGDYFDGKQGTESPENPKEINTNIVLRLKDLQNDVIAFQSALADRELSYEEQKNLFNALKDKHDRLKNQVGVLSQQSTRSHGIGTDNAR